MKVLIYEYITGGGKIEQPEWSLVKEGDAMFQALCNDLSDIPGLFLTAMRDRRLRKPSQLSNVVQWIDVDPDQDPLAIFQSQLDFVDAVWPIAPETDNILEGLCRRVEGKGKILLNTPAEGVHLAASKLKTAQRLEQHGIPVVPTRRWEFPDESPPFTYPFVIKADDGAGCENSHIIGDPSAWASMSELFRPASWIFQPLMTGESVSMSALFAHGKASVLSCNRQYVYREDNTFYSTGIVVNAMGDEAGMFSHLLDLIAEAMPELWGYAGVDLVQHESELTVLEINPRLTSSYSGIRAANGTNPARLVMDLFVTQILPEAQTGTGKAVEITWDKLPS